MLQAIPDTNGKVEDVAFCGLRANLSEIVSRFTSGKGTILTIFVDSLVVDIPSFNASGVVLVARSIDVSIQRNNAVQVSKPVQGDVAVLELLVGESIGGNLQLISSGAIDKASAFQVPTGANPLRAVYYTMDKTARVSTEIKTEAADIQDLLKGTWALNSLKASLTAASWLLDSRDDQDRATARSMLRWVVSCVLALGNNEVVPGDFAELYTNAAALLITIDLAPGAYYVPILSSHFYREQADMLLSALSQYEGHATALEVGGAIQQAIASVSATLEDVSNDEISPLRTQLEMINDNLKGLTRDIITLSGELQAQLIAAGFRLKVLQAKISSQRTGQMVEAAFTIVVDAAKIAISLGVGGGGNESAVGGQKKPGDALTALVDLVKNAVKIADIAAKDSPNRDLLDCAVKLAQMQAQLMTAFVSGKKLWNKPQNDAVAPKLPEPFSANQADPALAWDNFIVEAESALTTIKEDIGTGTGASQAQVAANKYLATLKIMAQYGKALDAKFLAAATQMAQGTVVNAQIRAAQTTYARWKLLETNAKSDKEKLTALKGIIQIRMDSIKRALFAAWVNYRNSYFYLYFQEPPRTIKLDMGAADLMKAFAGMGDWIASLHGDSQTAQQIRLPDDNVQITYTFKIIRPDEIAEDEVDTALLIPRSRKIPASLTWVIPAHDNQMAGVLPEGGQVAIWIKEARFFIEGVVPNSKGNVIAAVSTSGAYQNGFGPKACYNFVTKGMVGNYAYHASDEKVYNPWAISTEVYSTPTPFTQWRMVFDADGGDPENAALLRMELKVAYLGRGDLPFEATR